MAKMLGAWMLVLIAAAAPAPGRSAETPESDDRYTLRAGRLMLAPQPEAPDRVPDQEPVGAARAGVPRFGEKGTEWIAGGLGIAHDFSDATDFNLRAGYSQFLVDDLEFALELNGWYFDQKGENAAGLNPSMIFRWHFVNEDPWTAYVDLGIGVLLATDNVPDGGTSLDFTPGAGMGITRRLNDSGARLQAGLRWHHISNGRLNGDIRNPSRDAPHIYMGLQLPF